MNEWFSPDFGKKRGSAGSGSATKLLPIGGNSGMTLRQKLMLNQKDKPLEAKPPPPPSQPQPIYPVEKPHPNLKQTGPDPYSPNTPTPGDGKTEPAAVGPRTFRPSLVIESTNIGTGLCASLTLRSACKVIAIIEMLFGLINMIGFAYNSWKWTYLNSEFYREDGNDYIKQAMSFTKSEHFSFLLYSIVPTSPNYVPYKLYGCLAMEGVRFLVGACLLVGVQFEEVVWISWVWILVTPPRIMAMFLLLPDDVYIIILEIIFVWIVLTYRHAGPEDVVGPSASLPSKIRRMSRGSPAVV